MIMSMRVRGTVHVAQMGENRTAYRMMGKPEGKRDQNIR
jgi:hypothetical protein